MLAIDYQRAHKFGGVPPGSTPEAGPMNQELPAIIGRAEIIGDRPCILCRRWCPSLPASRPGLAIISFHAT